jgi:Helicase associated domain
MDRVERLESVGFEWSVNPLPAVEQWEAKWELLRDFSRQFGHCRVPHKYQVDGIKLGQWVSYQRNQKSRKERGLPCEITDERVDKLDVLGFEWRALEGASASEIAAGPVHVSGAGTIVSSGSDGVASWDTHYEMLLRFKKVNGHTRVVEHFALDGISLGKWVRYVVVILRHAGL